MLRRALAVCALLWLPLPVLAAGVEFRAGDAVTIAADEVIEGDLYASGDTVTIAGVVLGDVVAAGREVRLTGRAEGDFIAAGQVVVVLGAVGDDMRVAGMVLQLGPEAAVADHVVAAGYSFETELGSRIGGDLVVRTAKARLAGYAESQVGVTASAVEIAGNVVGDVEAEVSGNLSEAPWFERFVSASVTVPRVADGLSVTDTARIGGRLSYSSPVEGAISDGVAGAGVEWDSTSLVADSDSAEEDRTPTLLSGLGRALQRFGALLIVGLLFLWRARAWVEARSDQLATNPLRSVGWGIASFVGGPLAAFFVLGTSILLAVLAGGLLLSRLALLFVLLGLALFVVLLVGFLVAILFGAPLLASVAAGRALLERGDPTRLRRPYVALVVGLAILILLTSLPVVGTGIGLLAIVAGLGPLVRWLTTLRRQPIAERVS